MPKPEQLPFDLGHRQAFDREDFWVSTANSDAVAWLDKWPDWPAPALVLWGPPASGKTHLLKVWRKKASAVEISSSDLASTSVDKLLGAAKAVIIDDAADAIGKPACEEALFHLYNLLLERKGHLLLAAEQPVKGWAIGLSDLKSRLMAAPSVALQSPDDELMAVVMTKLFSDRQIFVSQEVVEFILTRIERSFQAVRDIVDKIDRKALAEKRAVTVPLVRDLLPLVRDLF